MLRLAAGLLFLLAQPAAAQPACEGLRGARLLSYRNPAWGFAMDYPAGFVLDPGSVPENGDSARFWAAGGRATAVVTGLRNRDGQSLAAVLAEAERDIGENGRGSITYRRVTPDWFVLSGYLADRIYYRRSFLGRGGAVIATLWIEFPRELKPCLEAAVATMSLSFRPVGP
ncbi:hypothetical protein E2C06_17360 [Dankookia rubra]|uniref:Uncharacterized protein n=1 Tax=Dankookia rubra TaxID=1442381 RepID=A0A4R5QE72_9PROT|nr:hypothetical protein [Dankookia rubra]TDH61276.1 hypothetical protein E2C06_17360 [Dankookia rubra]